MSSGDTWDVRNNLPWLPSGPVDAYTEGWPTFAQTWLGGEFRPRPNPAQRRGWTCGCGRGFSPDVRECPYCPEAKATEAAPAPPSRDLTWAPDALERDDET